MHTRRAHTLCIAHAVHTLCTRDAAAAGAQNNAVDIYENYFEADGASETTSNEAPSAKTLAVFKDPSEIKRTACRISWFPDGGRRIAVAFSIMQARMCVRACACASHVCVCMCTMYMCTVLCMCGAPCVGACAHAPHPRAHMVPSLSSPVAVPRLAHRAGLARLAHLGCQ